jgi:transposase, IS5 family
VPWEGFRGRLEAVWRRPAAERKSKAGRRPGDAIVMSKAAANGGSARADGRAG